MFTSYNDTLKAWLKNYPQVQPLDMGANPLDDPTFHEITRKFMFTETDIEFTTFPQLISKLLLENYPENYRFYRQYILANNVDIAIYDFCNAACSDAAYETGYPIIITVHMLGTFGKLS